MPRPTDAAQPTDEDEESPSRRGAAEEVPYQNFGTAVGDGFPPCDREIFERGLLVRTSPLDKEATQEIVEDLQGLGWRVDWHWEHSRLAVKALEPMERMGELRCLFAEALTAKRRRMAAEDLKLTQQHEAALLRRLGAVVNGA